MNQRTHYVLFVDDDPMILRGFQRSMDEYCENWVAGYASSGAEALSKLSVYTFDAVVTDMHMPGMDGIQLLDAISKTHPGVIRFVLSGNTSDAQILKSTHLVHQMIPKPCEMGKIYEIVERACRLREMLTTPQLIQIITGIKNLPSVPRIYNQLLEQLQSETVSAQAIGNIIAQDAAMTAKILQLVNSAFFGIADNITSPQKAVTILGINTIKSLVLGIQVFSQYQGLTNLPISVDFIWKHSLHVSGLSFMIARSLNLSAQEREEARVAGVLHDVGLLLAFQIPGYFQNVKFTRGGQAIIETEYKYMGTSHAEMGGYLLGIWGLPTSIVEAVTFHHFPGMHTAKVPGMLSTLYTANSMLNMIQSEKKPNFPAYFDMAYINNLGIANRLEEWYTAANNILNSTN